MDRLACISVPGLALQVALRRLPPSPGSVVLVKDDRPTSPILNLNAAARAQGLQAGMRYSEALVITRELRAVVVEPNERDAARGEILDVLARWSPEVEPCTFDEGCFWVSASGLSALYGTEAEWGSTLRQALTLRRWKAFVVVGDSRAGTYVLARTRRRSSVVQSRAAEQRALDEAPISLFPLTERQRRLLGRLGLATVGAVLALPRAELDKRLGPELARDLSALRALDTLPLQTPPRSPEYVRRQKLEPAVADRQALVPRLTPLVEDGLRELARRGRVLAELRLVFVLEEHGVVSEVIRPAEATTNPKIMHRLLTLRMEHVELPEPVAELRLLLLDAAAPKSTGELFAAAVERDLRRGAEALAVLRARWGNDAVVRAVPQNSHIPERSYRWEEATALQPARPSPREPTRVRRVGFDAPPSSNPSGRRLGSESRLRQVSGGVVDRSYWFLRNPRGEVLWVSHDHLTGTTALEGEVD